MKDAIAAQVNLSVLTAVTGVMAGTDRCEKGEFSIPLAETIAELRFKENVYQSIIEVSRRTLAVLSMFEFTS